MDADPIETRVAESLAAHRRRWVLTPLTGKKPIMKDWTTGPAPTEEEVVAWARKSNVGLRTGRVSGVVVVDVDRAKGGRLEEHPRTPTVRTGSGGEHLYFAAPDLPLGNSVGKLAPHVDVRADGGQVVFPGSVHPESGRVYRWEQGLSPDEIPLAPFPADWLAKLTSKNGSSRRATSRSKAGSLVPYRGTRYGLEALRRECEAVRTAQTGSRNDTLNRAAFALGQLVVGGELHHSAAADLFEAATECGLVSEDGETAVRATIRSGLDAGTKEPRTAPGRGSDASASGASGRGVPPVSPEPPPVEELEPVVDQEAHQTELGLAQRIVACHGNDLLHCFPWGAWLVWDGTHWMQDESGAVWRLAKKVVLDLYQEAINEPDPERKKGLLKFALRCEKETCIRAALSLARSDVSVVPGDLNQDVWLLNTPTGTLDLRTGNLRAHRREDHLTKLCPTPYDPVAEHPEFDRFLLRIVNRDVLTILYLQRAFGYALTAAVKEHVIFFLVGAGANGKSTLVGAIVFAVGRDYAVQVAPKLLFEDQKDTHPTGVADLYGKRIAATHELDAGSKLAEGLVKQLTGGDRVKARRMRQDFWEFDPTHTLFLCTNTKPVIRGSDEGIWRRIRLVPFRIQIPKAEQDGDLPEKLRAEAPGILAWLVEGARSWMELGLDDPDEVLSATAAYRSESDVVGEFIAARCIVSDDSRAKAKNLYEAYCNWHREALGGEPVSQKTFGGRLSDRGYVRRKDGAGNFEWRGLGLA